MVGGQIATRAPVEETMADIQFKDRSSETRPGGPVRFYGDRKSVV